METALRVPVGSRASRSQPVTEELTVAHFHSHMPQVYGTPMMIYLMEVAAAGAVDEHLPPGWISLGAAVDVRHLAPTPVGFTVTASAEVTSIDGNRIVLAVAAHDELDKIGEGTHVRVAVEQARLAQRVRQKSRANPA